MSESYDSVVRLHGEGEQEDGNWLSEFWEGIEEGMLMLGTEVNEDKELCGEVEQEDEVLWFSEFWEGIEEGMLMLGIVSEDQDDEDDNDENGDMDFGVPELFLLRLMWEKIQPPNEEDESELEEEEEEEEEEEKHQQLPIDMENIVLEPRVVPDPMPNLENMIFSYPILQDNVYFYDSGGNDFYDTKEYLED